MIEKVISYVDFNGVARKESFFFNFTKAELAEMELSSEGGLDSKLQKIVDSKDTPVIAKIFKDIILHAYGEKSEDGRRFVKGAGIREAFEQTEAYSNLFMQLISDPAKAAEFIKGILPRDMQESLNETEIAKITDSMTN